MLPRIRRSHPRFVIFFATVFGIFSGVYIWKPLFEEKTKELRVKVPSESS